MLRCCKNEATRKKFLIVFVVFDEFFDLLFLSDGH